MIAAAALSAGLLAAAPGVASAQSPAEVLPTQITQAQVQGTQLSRTGSDTMPLVLVGSGLAAAGAVIVVAARKRRSGLLPA
jgi:LPXTG-motif cell wall-anchored protein